MGRKRPTIRSKHGNQYSLRRYQQARDERIKTDSPEYYRSLCEVGLLQYSWDSILDDLSRTIHSLSEFGSKIVLVGPIPEWQPTLPQRLFQESFLRGGAVPDWLSDPSQLNGATLDRAMANFARDAGIEYISLFGLLCKHALCMTTIPRGEERSLIEWDYSHLTKDGADWIVDRRVAPAIIKGLSHADVTDNANPTPTDK